MRVLISFVMVVGLSNGHILSYTTLKYLKNRAIEVIDNAGPKDDCSRHLKAWVQDLFNWKNLWAMEMLDASAKLQSGFFDGNIFHFGNYDQCLRIRGKKEDNIIEGQYCTVALTPSKNSSNDLGQLLDFTNTITKILGKQEGYELKHILRLVKVIYGICIPKTCTADNLQKLWNHVEFTFRLPLHVTFGDDFCSYKGKVTHSYAYDGEVIWAFIIFFSFLFFATLYDTMILMENTETNIWNDIITSFSFRRNIKKVLDMSGSCEDDRFSCIMGMKVLSMFWVVFGHKYTISYFSGSINMLEFFEFRKTLSALLILVSPFAVDTFLSISGLLLAYKYMQLRDMMSPDKSFPYFMFYFMRFLRLWPALLALVFVYLNILKYLNDGPLWPLYNYKTTVSCSHTGLATLLFATNHIPFYTQCLEHSWYLAVDTQLYCLAPLILYFLYYYPKRISFLLVLLASILSVRSYYITYVNKHKWNPSEGDDTFHSEIYMSVIVRMPVWICGVLTGALLYNYPHVRINKIVANIIWSIALLLLLMVFYVNNYLIIHSYNEHHAGLFNALARPAWGLAICLVIFLCANGDGGCINKFLSLNIYKPITKISYSVFLIHSAVIITLHGGKRSVESHSLFSTLHSLLGDIPVLMCASLIWCLAFESPFINLTKLMYRRESTKPGAIENKKTFPEFKATKKELRSRTTKLD